MRRDQKEQRSGSLDRWRKRHEQVESERGGRYCLTAPSGVDFFTPKKSDRYLKLIGYITKDHHHPDAYEPGDVVWRRPYGKHKNVGGGGVDVACLNYPRKGKCPACEERERLRADRADEKSIQAMAASRRAAYLVVDIEAKEPKLEIFEAPDNMGKAPGFGRMLEEEILRLDSASPAPWDLDGPIMLVRFGEDEYAGHKFFPVTKVDLIDQDDKKHLPPRCSLDFSEFEPENVPCLDDCLNRLSYTAFEKMLLGLEEEDAEDEKPASPPPRSNRDKPEPEPEPEPDFELSHNLTELRLQLADMGREQLNSACDALELRAPRKFSSETNNTKSGLETYRAWIADNLPEDWIQEEMEPPPTPPPRSNRGKPAPAAEKKSESTKCPSGHTFGKDCDDHKECQKCPKETWEACADEQERLNG